MPYGGLPREPLNQRLPAGALGKVVGDVPQAVPMPSALMQPKAASGPSPTPARRATPMRRALKTSSSTPRPSSKRRCRASARQHPLHGRLHAGRFHGCPKMRREQKGLVRQGTGRLIQCLSTALPTRIGDSSHGPPCKARPCLIPAWQGWEVHRDVPPRAAKTAIEYVNGKM